MTNALVIGLGLALLALLAGVFIEWQRKMAKLRQEEQLTLSRARQKALHIVSHARDQALQIMASAKISANHDKSKLEENLDKISADQLREFQNLLSSISKDIESDALKEIGDFKSALQLETVQSQKVVAEQIQAKYDQTQKELEEYKAVKLKEIDGQIKAILAQVIKKLAGKAVPIDIAEEQVISALKEAKNSHVI